MGDDTGITSIDTDALDTDVFVDGDIVGTGRIKDGDIRGAWFRITTPVGIIVPATIATATVPGTIHALGGLSEMEETATNEGEDEEGKSNFFGSGVKRGHDGGSRVNGHTKDQIEC